MAITQETNEQLVSLELKENEVLLYLSHFGLDPFYLNFSVGQIGSFWESKI